MTEQTWDTEPDPDAPPIPNHACAGCGQLDDHPMVHVAGSWEKPTPEGRLIVDNPSFHFDCLPDDADDLWGLDLSAPQHANAALTREAALGGVHGDELRTFIASLPSDNELPEA